MGIEPGWLRMSPEYILEHFRLWNDPETPHFESQNLHFSLPTPPFSKMSLFTFPPQLTVFSTNLQIHAVQNVPMDHTDHFRFHHFFDFDLFFSIKI